MIETPRLILREWQEQDAAPFAAMNADPQVMRYFPAPLSCTESDNMLARIRAELNNEPFGVWAVERKEDRRMIGFTGLHRVTFDGPLQGRIEIEWRLCSDLWGQGYAPEAAGACLEFARQAGIEEIVSFTAAVNLPSQRVMQKIGMQYHSAFDHPALPAKHPLLKHVLYTIEL